MSDQTIAKLHKISERLDADLSFDLAIALSDKLQTTQEAIFQVYENWQIS